MSSSVESALGSVAPLVQAIFAFCDSHGIATDLFQVDHACYRVDSIAAYRSTLAALVPSCGHVAGECMIGGRPIATIALHQPLEVTLASSGRVICIPALELPCPKPGRAYATGWEHAEIAISSSIESPLNTQAVLREFMNQYPQVQWNIAALDKHCNADVSVSVTDQFAVKFHAVPLLQVVAFEIRNQSFEPVPEGFFN